MPPIPAIMESFMSTFAEQYQGQKIFIVVTDKDGEQGQLCVSKDNDDAWPFASTDTGDDLEAGTDDVAATGDSLPVVQEFEIRVGGVYKDVNGRTVVITGERDHDSYSQYPYFGVIIHADGSSCATIFNAKEMDEGIGEITFANA